jgi:hypothetical protein
MKSNSPRAPGYLFLGDAAMVLSLTSEVVEESQSLNYVFPKLTPNDFSVTI